MISFLRRFLAVTCIPSLAFAGTVGVAYLASLWEGAIRLDHRRGDWCLILGVIYALSGMVSYFRLREKAGPRWLALYLCAQAGLVLAILLASRLNGEMVYCVFPLVGVAVLLLSPLAATLGVVGLYSMVLAVEGHDYGVQALERWSISLLAAFGFVVIFTWIALREIAARTRAESLSAELEQLAVVQERNRLAREIHDSLGHFLTTIHVQLEAARAIHAADPGLALEGVAKAQGLARDALVEVRRSVGALQADRAQLPLAERLRDLTAATDGWGTAVSLEILGDLRGLTGDAEHALFRAAQEGLTNVRKHAQARNARVTLDFSDPGRVGIRVTDDGRGRGAGSAGHGLAGLRERVAALGGRVIAEQLPGGGFRLQVEIPA